MLAYVLLACFLIPLLILVVDVASPRAKRPTSAQGLRPTAPRAHVSAAATDRRDVHRVAGEEPAERAPRIAPGDGMVYRPTAGSSRRR